MCVGPYTPHGAASNIYTGQWTTSHLQEICTTQVDVHRFYANATLFYRRHPMDCAICRPITLGPQNQVQVLRSVGSVPWPHGSTPPTPTPNADE